MSLVKQTAVLDDDTALFRLALGPANRIDVVLCGGSLHGFLDISSLYEVWASLHIPVAFIIPPGLEHYVPSGVPYVISDDHNRPIETTATWRTLDAADMMIVGPNMQLTSSQQLFFSKLLPTIKLPTILTDEALSLWRIDKTIQHNRALILLISLQSAIKLANGTQPHPERGIFGVQEFIQGLPLVGDIFITYDSLHIYTYIRCSDTIIYTPVADRTLSTRNIILSLLPITLYARASNLDLEARVRVLHSLFAQITAGTVRSTAEWVRLIKRQL